MLWDQETWFKYRDVKHIGAAGPAEFLQWIAGAKCVVTNSFHATAFSIILNTPFYVETEIEKNIQIAIACMKDASGDPEKAAYIVAFPEQEEWTISTDEGITTSNAMSTFMIQTSDGKEIGFIKDNCPSDENALTSDSGDSVIVTYVTSDNANFPLEIRKGK